MAAIKINQATDMLLIIDVQYCFMPGGSLPVADGDAVIAPINRLSRDLFDHAVATQDWHPTGHASFASSHQGHAAYDSIALPYGAQTLWPDHAIHGTRDAEIHADLSMDKVQLILRKGFHPAIDSYSGFFENDRATPTGLDFYLRGLGFKRLFLTGLATDFCVAYTAEDGAKLGYEVYLIEDACRGIGLSEADGRTTLDNARARLTALGVKYLHSGLLTA